MSAVPVDDNEGQRDSPRPNRSARVIGEPYGMNGMEMNTLLKEQGFLEGEPGAYHVTPKGAPYANERIEGRGTGGSLQYNPSWGLTTWKAEIEDELDLTAERVLEARQATTAERRRKAEMKAAEAEAEAEADDDSDDDDDEARDAGFEVDPLKVVAWGLAGGALVFGFWKAAPHARRLWSEKATPRLRAMKNRAVGGAEPDTDKPDDEDPPA